MNITSEFLQVGHNTPVLLFREAFDLQAPNAC